MTAGRLPERDRADIEALMADHYLDGLLAAADRRAADVPADAALDPALRDAARVLRWALVRVHPSFRFEERLAARLADFAAVQSRPAAAAGAVVVAFPGSAGAGGAALDADPLLAAVLAGELDPADADPLDADARPAGVRRPLIVGGAITSAAISLVGVAWVAWRAARPGPSSSGAAMGRAARTAHARRLAADALATAGGLSGGGIGGPA
ncbi:MAG: hypothetical protein A2V85_08925 [Chloroflexi bacterium RBG_16_72_14]|nr:MAG: hypothetical protein A2V85_08925 [Chloroflexi bacterium RBG_16_72_14]